MNEIFTGNLKTLKIRGNSKENVERFSENQGVCIGNKN